VTQNRRAVCVSPLVTFEQNFVGRSRHERHADDTHPEVRHTISTKENLDIWSKMVGIY